MPNPAAPHGDAHTHGPTTPTVERVALDSLIPLADNPRQHGPRDHVVEPSDRLQIERPLPAKDLDPGRGIKQPHGRLVS